LVSWKSTTLTSWGRAQAEVVAARPERIGGVLDVLAAPLEGGLLAYGAGRSYGDAALNGGGHQVLTGRLDRLLAFDPDSGQVVAEAGVTFDDLRRVFLPRGFVPPVIPGTGFATLGGAVANDVHGKNHDHAGSFGNHLDWIDLALPNGAAVRCSATELPELFEATIGGIGLTGIILQMAFRLVRVPSGELMVREERMPDLDAFLATFAHARRHSTFSVGWIDAMARGRSLGRGIIETAEWAPLPSRRWRERAPHRVPCNFPAMALNPLSVAAFNQLYWHRVPAGGREREVPADRFFHPLDKLHDWNRIYGKHGFHQFQCVLPDGTAEQGLTALLTEIGNSRAASFLAVLKTLGSAGLGALSFPQRGYTLALDFPHRRHVWELLSRLEAITLDHGGRIYLAKDSALSPQGFARMYPRLEEFRNLLDQIDPDQRMTSSMARRLGLREVRS
jgi:decaprenylphospho-beta-D-ribofuranose 2-oxidase